MSGTESLLLLGLKDVGFHLASSLALPVVLVSLALLNQWLSIDPDTPVGGPDGLENPTLPGQMARALRPLHPRRILSLVELPGLLATRKLVAAIARSGRARRWLVGLVVALYTILWIAGGVIFMVALQYGEARIDVRWNPTQVAFWVEDFRWWALFGSIHGWTAMLSVHPQAWLTIVAVLGGLLGAPIGLLRGATVMEAAWNDENSGG